HVDLELSALGQRTNCAKNIRVVQQIGIPDADNLHARRIDGRITPCGKIQLSPKFAAFVRSYPPVLTTMFMQCSPSFANNKRPLETGSSVAANRRNRTR